MKLESYKKATPIVNGMLEAETFVEKMDEVAKDCGEDLTQVKITFTGKVGYGPVTRTITVKNPDVQKLVFDLLRTSVGAFLNKQEKQLETIK